MALLHYTCFEQRCIESRWSFSISSVNYLGNKSVVFWQEMLTVAILVSFNHFWVLPWSANNGQQKPILDLISRVDNITVVIWAYKFPRLTWIPKTPAFHLINSRAITIVTVDAFIPHIFVILILRNLHMESFFHFLYWYSSFKWYCHVN